MKSWIKRIPGILILYERVTSPGRTAIEILMHLIYWYRIFKDNRRSAAVLIYPDRLTPVFIIWKVFKARGLKEVNELTKPADLCVLWHDSTIVDASKRQDLLNTNITVINKNALDISKKKVHKVFFDTFGYTHEVDPIQHEGLCVEKSNFNYTHDGRVLQCPILTRRDDCVYEQLIDNTIDHESVVDLRVPVIGEAIPFVYKKYRPKSDRFSNTNSYVELTNPDELFSYNEMKKILEFSRRMGCDFCELDVLRDNNNKKIYIVDVNVTPAGPPNHLPFGPSLRAIMRWSEAFDREFIRVPTGRRKPSTSDDTRASVSEAR